MPSALTKSTPASTGGSALWQNQWREMLSKQKRQRDVRESFRNMKDSQLDMRKLFPPLNPRNAPSDSDYRVLRERVKKVAYRQKETLHELHETLGKLEEAQEERDVLVRCWNIIKEKDLLAHRAAPDAPINVQVAWVQDVVDAFLPWCDYIAATVYDNEPPDDLYTFGPFWGKLTSCATLRYLINAGTLLEKLEELDGEMERSIEPFKVRCAANNPLFELRLAEVFLDTHPWLGSVMSSSRLLAPKSTQVINNVLEYLQLEDDEVIEQPEVLTPGLKSVESFKQAQPIESRYPPLPNNQFYVQPSYEPSPAPVNHAASIPKQHQAPPDVLYANESTSYQSPDIQYDVGYAQEPTYQHPDFFPQQMPTQPPQYQQHYDPAHQEMALQQYMMTLAQAQQQAQFQQAQAQQLAELQLAQQQQEYYPVLPRSSPQPKPQSFSRQAADKQQNTAAHRANAFSTEQQMPQSNTSPLSNIWSTFTSRFKSAEKVSAPVAFC